MDDDRRRKSRGKCHRRKNRGAVVLCCLPFRDSMELSLINIRILDEYLHSDEFSLGRARTLENTERFGMSRKLGIDWKNTNDVTTRLGYACKYFPFVVSVEKKKEKQIFLLRACRRIVNAKKHLSYLPSGISFHRGDPSNFPEGSFASSQRIIAVSTAHHRHPGGQQEARKASLARLRRFAVRRSPYWRRANFPPIGDRACEAWVRIAPNSWARCPTMEPPHPRMSRAHEQLKYRSNSRSRTLVPVASIVLPDRSLDSFAFLASCCERFIVIIADNDSSMDR